MIAADLKAPGALEITTPSDRDILITRVFNAPRQLVFDAYTKPELLTRWMGVMPGWTFAVCEIDLRVGGAYRYVWHGPDNAVMGMSGVFLEVAPPRRLVAAEKYDQAWYEGSCVETVEFEEKNGRTTLTMALRYDSKEIRDAVLQTPMATGMEMGFVGLAKLLETLTA